jgi:hypothetical protein
MYVSYYSDIFNSIQSWIEKLLPALDALWELQDPSVTGTSPSPLSPLPSPSPLSFPLPSPIHKIACIMNCLLYLAREAPEVGIGSYTAKLCTLAKKIVRGDLPVEYNYHQTPAPWMQITILALFSTEIFYPLEKIEEITNIPI